MEGQGTQAPAGTQGGGDGTQGGGAPATQSGGADFLSTLPTELRSEGSLKGFHGPDGAAKLAKSYAELNRAFSTRNMADMEPPKDEAARKAVLAKLGAVAPDTIDGYKLPAEAKSFAERALKHGLTPQQAESLYREQTATETERKTRMEARSKEYADTLRKEWGDKFESEIALARNGFEHFLPESERKLLEATGIADNPAIVKLFNNLGRALKEGTMLSGSGNPGTGTSVEALKAERIGIESKMSAMQKAPNFDPTNSEYRQHMKQRQEILSREAQAAIASTGVR